MEHKEKPEDKNVEENNLKQTDSVKLINPNAIFDSKKLANKETVNSGGKADLKKQVAVKKATNPKKADNLKTNLKKTGDSKNEELPAVVNDVKNKELPAVVKSEELVNLEKEDNSENNITDIKKLNGTNENKKGTPDKIITLLETKLNMTNLANTPPVHIKVLEKKKEKKRRKADDYNYSDDFIDKSNLTEDLKVVKTTINVSDFKVFSEKIEFGKKAKIKFNKNLLPELMKFYAEMKFTENRLNGEYPIKYFGRFISYLIIVYFPTKEEFNELLSSKNLLIAKSMQIRIKNFYLTQIFSILTFFSINFQGKCQLEQEKILDSFFGPEKNFQYCLAIFSNKSLDAINSSLSTHRVPIKINLMIILLTDLLIEYYYFNFFNSENFIKSEEKGNHLESNTELELALNANSPEKSTKSAIEPQKEKKKTFTPFRTIKTSITNNVLKLCFNDYDANKSKSNLTKLRNKRNILLSFEDLWEMAEK